MKKTILPLFLSSLLLCGCGGNNTSSSSNQPSDSSISSSTSEYQLDLRVAVPAGAPAVSLFRHLSESEDKLEINAGEDAGANVVGYLSSSSNKDIVICPTNAGIKAIKAKSAPFKIAATLTFGNFYLAATGNDDDGVLDADDYVVAFQQNNVPDLVFKYVYEDMNLSNVHYVGNAANAAATLITGKNSYDEEQKDAPVDYVLLAEPALTNALSKNPNASEYASMQTKFKEKSGGLEIMQASVFVRNDTDTSKVNAFLSSLKEDVEAFVENPDVLDPYIESLGENEIKSKFSVPSSEILKAVTKNGNRMGLGYKKASENKDAIANFLGLFNVEIDEALYYL